MASLPDFGTPIFAADFQKYSVGSVMAPAKSKTCEQYEVLFSAEARRLGEDGDYAGFQLFRLLAAACSLMPQFGNTKDPFRPKMIDYVNHCSSPGVKDFSPEQCATFKEVLSLIDDELRARLADVVTIRNFDHQVVVIAAEAYLKSALQLVSQEHWHPCIERLRRAFWLSSRPGIGKAVYQKVLDEARRLVEENHEKDNGLFTAHLISLVTTFDTTGASRYSELVGKLANRTRIEKRWHVSRCYFGLLRNIYRVSKPPQEEKSMAAVAEIAETFALEAEEAETAAPPQYGKACHCYEQARKAYGAVKGKRERRGELYKKLLVCQELSMDETTFVNIGSEIPVPDLSPVIEGVKLALKGKIFREAVLTFVGLFSSLDFEKTAKNIRSPENPSPWSDIIPQNKVDTHGKTKARKTSIMTEALDEASQFEYAYCHRHAQLHWGLTTSGILIPGLLQISEEHAIQPEDIAFIAEQSGLVPLDRVELISRGLHYGFLGDLQLALHLLIPQFENSLRFILHQRGEVASVMDSEDLQNERNINTLLPKHPALEQMFGKDLLWDFWALLVAEWGCNIRNHIAHGMTADKGFFGPESIYAWCLLLKFYCLPLLEAKSKKPKTTA